MSWVGELDIRQFGIVRVRTKNIRLEFLIILQKNVEFWETSRGN